MTVNAYVTQNSASGEEIGFIAQKIENALEGVDLNKALIALLSLYVVVQHPAIEPEALKRIVENTSHFVVHELTGTDNATQVEANDSGLTH